MVELLIAHGQAAAGAADPTLDTDQLVTRLGVRGYAPDRVLVNVYLGQLARQGYVRTAPSTPGGVRGLFRVRPQAASGLGSFGPGWHGRSVCIVDGRRRPRGRSTAPRSVPPEPGGVLRG